MSTSRMNDLWDKACDFFWDGVSELGHLFGLLLVILFLAGLGGCSAPSYQPPGQDLWRIVK